MKYLKFIIITLLLFPALIFSQEKKGTTYVTLKNGEKVYGKVEVKTPFLGKNYIMLNDTIRYSFSDINFFQNENGYYAVIDGDVAKRTYEGNLDLYNNTELHFSPGNMQTISTPFGGSVTLGTPSSFSHTSTDYFSKNGSPVKEASYSNLKEALADNPGCLQLLNEYNTLSYVKYGAGIIGAGIIVSAFIGNTGEEKVKTGNLIAGGIVMNLSWIPLLMQRNKIKNAIKLYNGIR